MEPHVPAGFLGRPVEPPGAGVEAPSCTDPGCFVVSLSPLLDAGVVTSS